MSEQLEGPLPVMISALTGVHQVFAHCGVFVIGVFLCGCGSSSAQNSADMPTAATSHETMSRADDNSTDREVATPRDLDCNDGTCFRCGDGVCPQGSYCDQDAQGGPACAWLSECSQAPTCSCVKKILGSSCSCDDSAGVSVSCQ